MELILSVILVNNDSFHGYLVRRNANNKTKYKYFSLGKKVDKFFVSLNKTEAAEVKKQADDYDVVLTEWQAKEKQKLKSLCLPSVRNNTGVKGIVLSTHKSSPTKVFMVCVNDIEGKFVMRSFSTSKGWTESWASACKFLSKVKGVNVVPLLNKMPKQDSI